MGGHYKPEKLFFITGIATSYFDYLTYPLVALMVPMTIYQASIQKYDRRTKFARLAEGSFQWALGYLGMWFGKWAIATLLTSVNVFDDAAAGIEMRSSMSGGNGEHINIGGILVRNIGGFVIIFFTPFAWYCIASNHAYTHVTTECKTLMISCLVLLYLLEPKRISDG